MKCPECGFAFSDLRDLCPRCKQDVRSFKRSKGIAVTSPEASYDELLRSFGGGSATAKSSSREPRSIFDTLKKLFQAVEEGTPEPPKRENLPLREEDVPAHRVSEAPPSLPQNTATPLPSALIPPGQEAAPKILEEQRSAGDAKVTALFEDAFRDLKGVIEEDFEIGAAALLSASTSEHIQLLFNLAEQSFEDVSIEARFQETGISSEARTVKSQEVQEKLHQAEAALKAPAFSLKETFRRRSETLREEGEEKRPQHRFATRKERLGAWAVDWACVGILGCFGGIAISYFEQSDLLWFALSGDTSALHMVGRTYVFGNIVTMGLVAFLFYPILCALFIGNASLGSRLMRCGFFRLNRKRAALYEHIHLRFLLLPFTSLLVVPSVLFGKLFSPRNQEEVEKELLLSDRWSGTALCSLFAQSRP